jgi:transcriptional regulator with XRE-family HTH domain
MARRPAADKNPPELPLTLQKAFDASFTSADEEPGPEDMTEAHVGERLRELRQQNNLNVRGLAVLSRLAINTLSMIENGKTSPSVSTLQILARALEVQIAAFFERETVTKKIVHVRRQQRPAVTVDATRLEHLGKDLAGNAVPLFVVTLEPGSGSGQNMITISPARSTASRTPMKNMDLMPARTTNTPAWPRQSPTAKQSSAVRWAPVRTIACAS